MLKTKCDRCNGNNCWRKQLCKAKKDEFVQFCMIVKNGVGEDFKADIKAGSSDSYRSSTPSTTLERLLEETTSRSSKTCFNKEWQLDFVCPVFLHRIQQAYSE